MGTVNNGQTFPASQNSYGIPSFIRGLCSSESRLRPRPLFKTLVQPPQRKIQSRQNHHQGTGRAGTDADDRVEFAMAGARKDHGRHQAGQQNKNHPLQAGRHRRSPFAELDFPFPQPPVHARRQQADGIEREQAPANANPEHEFIHRLHPSGIIL